MGIPRWWSASGTAKNFKKENERYKETDTQGFAQQKFDDLSVEAPGNFAGLDDRPPAGRSYDPSYAGGQSSGLGTTSTRDPGSPTQNSWGKTTSCLSSSDCASGYACVGGGCVFMSANVNSGSWNSPGGGDGGPCPPPPGNNPCNTGGPGACQSGPTCGDPPGGSPVDCCGGGLNITLGDGGVLPVCGVTNWSDRECDSFCDSIFKNFGVYGLGCSKEADNQVCPPCEECDFFTEKCEPIAGDTPCYCKENPCGDCYKCETNQNSAAFGECVKSLDSCNFCVELPCRCQCSETTVFGCGPTEADARAAALRQCANICESRDSADEDCDGPCGDNPNLQMKLIARWEYFLGGDETSRHAAVCTNGPAPTYVEPYSTFLDPCGNPRQPVHTPPGEGNFQYYVPQDPFLACINCDDLAIGTGCPGA